MNKHRRIPEMMNRFLPVKRVIATGLLAVVLGVAGCARLVPPQSHSEVEEEPLSRTEFTSRIENFFEYEPLKANRKSQFLIHLTDLGDGSPVERAEIVLTVHTKGQPAEITRTTARIGKVTGIYVADLTISQAGQYDIDFRVKNDKLDERLALTDFTVE
ncbi:MAG: hypothetical protein K1Y36_30755 [Blastocatellia bacterium]|nr:hypothetical protein [Blastocatellia bacterium]